MATTTVPGFLQNLQTLLKARPALADVPVLLLDSDVAEKEAIVLARVTMSGARFLGWGAGAAALATVEPLNLAGYVFAEIVGNDNATVVAAWQRAGVLLAEVMQQLRDDPTIADALVAPQRLQPPLVDSAVWHSGPDERERVSLIGVIVDFSIVWSAITA